MAIKKQATEIKTKTEPTYKVLEECGVLSVNGRGWETKLRYISWNNGTPKYDIRPWFVNKNGEEQCRKGITLTGEELEALLGILKKMEE